MWCFGWMYRIVLNVPHAVIFRQFATPLHLWVLPSLAACLELLRMVRRKLSASLRPGKQRWDSFWISSKRLCWHTCGGILFPQKDCADTRVCGKYFPGDKGGACWQAAGVAGETRLGAPLPGGTFTFTLPGETFTLPGKRPSSKSLRFYPKLVSDGIQDLIQNIFVIRLKFAVPWHSSTWGSLPQCEWHPNDAKEHQVGSSKREYGKQSMLLNAHFWLQLLPGGEEFSLAIHRCWQSSIYIYMDGCSTVVLKWDMGMGIKWISGRGEVQSTLRC